MTIPGWTCGTGLTKEEQEGYQMGTVDKYRGPVTLTEFDTWIRERWESKGRSLHDTSTYLSNAICGEAGELANKVKKITRRLQHLDFSQHPSLIPVNVTPRELAGLGEECGDTLHYTLRFMQNHGLTIQDVVKGNVAKLAERENPLPPARHLDDDLIVALQKHDQGIIRDMAREIQRLREREANGT